jgi:multidrug efflux pump subunit AcrA (membrane-fusion protein)
MSAAKRFCDGFRREMDRPWAGLVAAGRRWMAVGRDRLSRIPPVAKIAIGAVGALLFIAAGLLVRQSDLVTNEDPISGAGHRTAQVERRDLEDVFILTGETRAVRSFEIVTPLTQNWQLQIKWLAEDGMEVQKGDSLIEFDSTNVAQAIEDARLQLTQAEIALAARDRTLAAELEKKRGAVELAEIEVHKARLEADVPIDLRSRREWHQKQSELHEKEAVLAKAQQDFASFTQTSKSETANLRIALAKTSRQLDQATRELGLLAVRAARPGIFVVSPHWQYWVENRKFQVGDMLYPGITVASIPDLSEMEVAAFLPAVRAASLDPIDALRYE